MDEIARTSKLFSDLYNGSPWIDVTIFETLQDITAETAAKKYPSLNSIWEIVNHVISWRQNILDRLDGKKIASPADNFFRPVSYISEAAWKRTLSHLDKSQKKWIDFLAGIQMGFLSDNRTDNPTSNHEYIHGILQHDAYHLGQIVLLKKLIKPQ